MFTFCVVKTVLLRNSPRYRTLNLSQATRRYCPKKRSIKFRRLYNSILTGFRPPFARGDHRNRRLDLGSKSIRVEYHAPLHLRCPATKIKRSLRDRFSFVVLPVPVPLVQPRETAPSIAAQSQHAHFRSCRDARI